MRQVLITSWCYDGRLLEGFLSIPDSMDLRERHRKYEKLQEDAKAVFDSELKRGDFRVVGGDERREKLGLNKTFPEWLQECGAVRIEVEMFSSWPIEVEKGLSSANP